MPATAINRGGNLKPVRPRLHHHEHTAKHGKSLKDSFHATTRSKSNNQFIGWGSLIVAAGVSYYWAKQGIDERRLQQAKAGSRPTDKLDCKFAVHLTDSDSYLDAFPLIWYFRAGTH